MGFYLRLNQMVAVFADIQDGAGNINHPVADRLLHQNIQSDESSSSSHSGTKSKRQSIHCFQKNIFT